MTKSLFIFAGEMSADLHGEKLIVALKKQDPTLTIYGVAGPKMRTTGMECILPMEAFQVMGFIDVLFALPKLIRHFFFLKKAILKRNPKTAIFIDYADFNMRLEASLRKSGYTGSLIHYISPSVWAWRPKRIQTLSKNLNQLLVIYPFEVGLFAKESLQVTYVGHPLIERLKKHTYKEDLFPTSIPLLSLFPGSRKSEIVRNLPLMLRAIKELPLSSLQIAVSLSHPKFKPLVDSILATAGIDVPILIVAAENNYELMQASHIALAKSGTVTLELALHEVPTVVIYKLSLIDKWIAHYLFRILLPYYCIVNISLNRMAFPEFFDHRIDPKIVGKALNTLLFDPGARASCQNACQQLKARFANKIASEEAAKCIFGNLEK